MRDIMFKSFFSFLVGLLFSSCGSSKASGKDTFLWTKKHISFVEKDTIWERSDSEVHAYFGMDYRNFNDSMQKYIGDPLGPIVGIWKINRYLGEKPKFKNCGEEPKIPESAFGTSDFEKIQEQTNILENKYRDCRDNNFNLKDKFTLVNYYYARSTNNHKPIIPHRPEGHALYEANIAFGPLGGIPFEKLNDEHQKIKEQLERWYCFDLYDVSGEKECYRLPGNESSIYYKVRSILKQEETSEGMASAPWQSPDYVHNSPYDWQEIKGIEITKEQYEYLYEKYKQSPKKPIIFRLDIDAPDLNDEQKSYIDTTRWDADTDEEAYQSILKDFYQ